MKKTSSKNEVAATDTKTSAVNPSDLSAVSRSPTVALITFAVLVSVGAVWTGYQAYDSHDFWNVAVPGISTGAGTLILAAVSFWLSGRQKRLDDAVRAAVDLQYALREARKVVPSFRTGQGQQTTIGITNAGRESIVEVHLQRAWCDGANVWNATPNALWEWKPNDFDSWISGGRTAGWYRRFIAPGQTDEFEGSLQRTAGGRQDAHVDSAARESMQIEVAWTDATGRHWLKHDWHEPVQLGEPPQPRSACGLEDATETETRSD